ncbi:unnamed protein product [Adineta steineri]|uniref:Uncharacterized protein n=1 Tax=Adineta steineri TaxID=433720 RepID=A0A818MS53_9BILA|nr:unnamed protein product [Adineta steineri]CAF0753076.1 unnamed protein product [Adineta steineri]CAF0875587.1 unnamed protein product [Adineta steineri]CAF3504562.1 unnamed protein product [Adineta steineri]CAF3555746.1 unnamed protein product [Adineta steineri]
MADIIFVIIGVTAGTGLLISSIITTYCCCKRYRRNRLPSNSQSTKQQHEEDYLHTVIINQHIAKHLRPNSALSFISNSYHNDMTLIAPPRRLAVLEQQQQLQKQHEPATLIIENPLISPLNHTIEQKPPSSSLQSYVYENPSLELGELQTIRAIQF